MRTGQIPAWHCRVLATQTTAEVHKWPFCQKHHLRNNTSRAREVVLVQKICGVILLGTFQRQSHICRPGGGRGRPAAPFSPRQPAHLPGVPAFTISASFGMGEEHFVRIQGKQHSLPRAEVTLCDLSVKSKSGSAPYPISPARTDVQRLSSLPGSQI